MITPQQAALIKRPLTPSIKNKVKLLNQESKETLIAMIINKVEFRAKQNPANRKGYISTSRGNCGKCGPCLLTQDCGECDYCLDKPKRGGAGTLRRKCKFRTCNNPAKKEKE